MTDKEMDQLLKRALSPEREPDARLNERIMERMGGRVTMSGKQKKKRISYAALAAAAVLVLGTLAAFGVWHYLSPDQVAQEVGNVGLQEAFAGPDAVSVNAVQEFGDYRVTLLGVVSGKNLSRYEGMETLEEDKTYAVTATERTDGTPMPDTSDDAYGEKPFFVTPLIRGEDPAWINVFTLGGGGYLETVVDGVTYRILECDNLEKFADRGLYLAVNSGSFLDQSAYTFDETSGEISRVEGYDGVNALFDLPLDAGKADREAAEQALNAIWEELFPDGR